MSVSTLVSHCWVNHQLSDCHAVCLLWNMLPVSIIFSSLLIEYVLIWLVWHPVGNLHTFGVGWSYSLPHILPEVQCKWQIPRCAANENVYLFIFCNLYLNRKDTLRLKSGSCYWFNNVLSKQIKIKQMLLRLHFNSAFLVFSTTQGALEISMLPMSTARLRIKPPGGPTSWPMPNPNRLMYCNQ